VIWVCYLSQETSGCAMRAMSGVMLIAKLGLLFVPGNKWLRHDSDEWRNVNSKWLAR
jgi:hypothetical protein